MAEGFSPLRFSAYARDLQRAVAALSRENMGDAIDRQKLKHEYPGGLQTRIVGPVKYVTLGQRTVEVSPMASDQEIATALNLDKIDTAMAHAPFAVNAMPPAVPAEPVGKPIPSSGNYVPGSLKTLLQGLRDRKASVMGEAVTNVKAAQAALDQVEKISADAKATADDIMAELAPFTNGDPT